jgi:hypothetical protein
VLLPSMYDWGRSDIRAGERGVIQGVRKVLSQSRIRVGMARLISSDRNKDLSRRSSREHVLHSAETVNQRFGHTQVDKPRGEAVGVRRSSRVAAGLVTPMLEEMTMVALSTTLTSRLGNRRPRDLIADTSSRRSCGPVSACFTASRISRRSVVASAGSTVM